MKELFQVVTKIGKTVQAPLKPFANKREAKVFRDQLIAECGNKHQFIVTRGKDNLRSSKPHARPTCK